MATGTVKWFNSEKGYGFISQDSGPDVFVHFSAIEGGGYRNLEENEKVEFEVNQGPKGPAGSQRQAPQLANPRAGPASRVPAPARLSGRALSCPSRSRAPVKRELRSAPCGSKR